MKKDWIKVRVVWVLREGTFSRNGTCTGCGLKRAKQTPVNRCSFKLAEEVIKRSFIPWTHQILFGWSNEEEWYGSGMWHLRRRGNVHTGFWRENLKEGDHLEDADIDGRVILKWIFEKWNGGTWTGFIWFRIEESDGLLWIRYRTFGFSKMRGIYYLADCLLTCLEGVCSMELVLFYTPTDPT